MTPEDYFDVWAPRGPFWSRWVKPVLFAHAGTFILPVEPEAIFFDLSWFPSGPEKRAVVVDLPGEQGIWFGLALAETGYRPIPLYNAAPGPELAEISSALPLSLVIVRPILAALLAATPKLAGLRLPADAPPAFLLDSNRRTGIGAPEPGRFDNRSVSFPTDFPSANMLLHHGIENVLLITGSGLAQPQPDLAHTLRRWQDAGMTITLKRLDTPGPPVPCTVLRPIWYRSIWHRLAAAFGLRRHPLGGFGGVLAEPSSG